MNHSFGNAHEVRPAADGSLRADIITSHAPASHYSAQENPGRRRVWSALQLCAALIVITALVQAWANRYEINEDGISYLEVASAYARHSWAAAVSAYWNPLYPALLALAFTLHRSSSGAADFAAAHAVNFVLFLGSFFCFQFFWAELRRTQKNLFPSSTFSEAPSWVWQLLGYALFFSCSLDLITITLVTPDLLISGLVFAIMGLLLRILRWQESGSGRLSLILLGILLGLGYLAKPVMLLFSIVVIATMTFARRREKLPVRSVALTVLSFLLLAGPYVGLISSKKHRFTMSENGPLTYFFVVGGYPYGYPHGVQLPSGSSLRHPPRLLFSKPAVYEFAKPVPGTCPIWYDTSYWYEGVKVRFAPAGQVRQIIKNTRTLARIVFVRESSLCVALLSLFLAAGPPRNLIKGVFHQWPLIIPAGTLVAVNALFNLEARLIAPYLTILWACLFGAVRPRASEEGVRFVRSLWVAAASLLAIGVLFQVGTDAANAERGVSTDAHHSTSGDRAVAAGLQKAGLPNSASVAYVGDSISAYWAHLAGIRIVGEVPIEDQTIFLSASEDRMKFVLAALARTGAAAVVSPSRPTVADDGWRLVPGTSYYIHFLQH